MCVCALLSFLLLPLSILYYTRCMCVSLSCKCTIVAYACIKLINFLASGTARIAIQYIVIYFPFSVCYFYIHHFVLDICVAEYY